MTADEGRSKRVALIRHGQGYHNPSWRKGGAGWLFGLLQRDAALTPRGRSEAQEVHQRLQVDASNPLHRVELVISSPLSRALETGMIIFGDQGSPPRCISPLCTERCVMPCDSGRSRSELANAFPGIQEWQGFATLPEVWWPRDRSYRQELEPKDRADEFVQMLLQQKERTIAVVGHAGFFEVLTGHHMKNCEVLWIDIDGESGEVRLDGKSES